MKKIILRFLRSQSGQVLPMALLMMIMATAIVYPGLTSAGASLSTNRDYENDVKSYYAAEAGMADAYWQLQQGLEPVYPYSRTLPYAVNGITVTWSLVKQAEAVGFAKTYTIKSAGLLSGVVRKQVLGEVVAVSGSSPFYYGIASLDGDITMSNNSQVTSTPAGHGDIFANGNIYLHNTASIAGKAAATGTIDCSHVQLGCTPSQPHKDFPLIDLAWYSTQADSGGTIQGGLNLWQQTNYNLGPKRIKGNLSIGKSTVNLNGVIWVEGTVDINNSSVIRGTSYIIATNAIYLNTQATTTGNPTFMSLLATSPGSYAININSGTTAGSLYAPYGGINLSNGGTLVYGSVIGKFVNIDSGASVNYQLNLQSNPPPGMSGGGSTTMTKYCND